MPNNKKKSKRPALANTYSIIALNTKVKSIEDDGEKPLTTTLHIGTLVNVNSVLNEKYAAIKVVHFETEYSLYEEERWKCPRDSLIHVDKDVWPYLASIPSPVERVYFLKEFSLLARLVCVDVGTCVMVVNCRSSPPLPAIVKYKGPVSSKGPGTYFGVELLDGEGETDGKLGNHEYFRCPPGTGMFVPVSKIRLPTASSPPASTSTSPMIPHNTTTTGTAKLPSSGLRFTSLSKQNGTTNHSDTGDVRLLRENGVLKTGEKVVWMSDDGPKHGVVLRYVSASEPSSIQVTVFFDPAVRLCQESSDYKNTQVLPATELIKSSDYYGYKDETHDKEMTGGSRGRDVKSSKSIDIVSGRQRHIRADADLIVFDTPPKYTSNQDGLSQRHEDQHCVVYDDEDADWNGRGEGSESDLGVGSLVQVEIRGSPHYGVVRWIGRTSHSSTPTAGIEMEEELDGLGDGMNNGNRYFVCNPGRGYFTRLSHCRSDARFHDIDTSAIAGATSSLYANTSTLDLSGGESPVIPGSVAPISREEDLGELCGKYRGIQGHHNSCYLDATLFSMFTFTSVFDSLLLRPANGGDIPQYSEVQRVLREEIVNPLRANLYVTSNRVMKLRTLLDRLSNVSGLTTEEKDPEEFLTSLVAQILRAEPFLKLSSGQEAYLYQLFLEKDESITFPTVQQLFDQSFLTSDIKLKQVPSCLIIQMPRFGRSYKMYPRILPSQVLDVTDVIQDSPRQCTVCGRLAEFECKQCFNQCDAGLQSISFCASCLETAHSHEKRAGHGKQRLSVPEEYLELSDHCTIPRIYMSLFAVLCIETSHYVAFVKCGTGPEAPWCFFDSMADRKGEQDGYNIPEVVACPYLPEWLSERGSQTLNSVTDEKQLPELAKRLFCDAYMCIYQSTEMMMYS